MKNLVFLSHTGRLGGAERCLHSLLKRLPSDRFRPLAIVPETGELHSAMSDLGIPVEVLPLKFIADGTASLSRFMPGADARIASVKQVIERHSADVVVTNTSTILEGALAARASGVPHVWHVLELLSADPALHPPLPLDVWYRLMLSLADRVVAVSSSVRDELLQFESACSPAADKVQVIHSGVETRTPNPAAGQKQRYFGVADDVPVVLYAGLFSRRKGLLDLAAAASNVVRRVPGTLIVLVGRFPEADDAELNRVLKRSHRSGSIRQMGWRDDVPELMAAADIVVVPSWSDPLPLVVLEAMSLGTPVVATESGGCSEMIVAGETGLLVPPRSPVLLGEAICTLIDGGPDLRRRMGESGRARQRELFHHERCTAQFADLLSKLAETRHLPNSETARTVLDLLSLIADRSWQLERIRRVARHPLLRPIVWLLRRILGWGEKAVPSELRTS